MVEIHGLHAGYAKEEILSGVDMTANSGEITTVIGVNGSGKSTLLKAISGIIPISSGEVLLDGTPLSALSPLQRAKHTAYLTQNRNTPDITAERLVLHGRFPYLSYPRRYTSKDMAIARQAMEEMGILPLADRYLRELSGGTRQKVYIAMALAQQCPIILMDEPNSFLDVAQQRRLAGILQGLAAGGKTILLVLHDLLFALQCSDRICMLHEGKIALSGTPRQIISDGRLQQCYGVGVSAMQTPHGIRYYYT